MRNTTWTIIKKEFYRFFRDWKMIICAVLLPAIITYGMFTILGSSMDESTSANEEYKPKCYVQNMPEAFGEILKEMNFEVIEATDIQEAKDRIIAEEADLLLIFPADFDGQLENLEIGGDVPNIEAYYYGTNMDSFTAYTLFEKTVTGLEASLFNVLDINRDVKNPDLAPDEDTASFLVSMFLPMMLITAMVTSCITFSVESIAGEKERGTMATLLVTPAKRSSIVIGKLVSLSGFALLAGLAEFISFMLALSKLSNSLINIDMYGFKEYASLLFVMISTVLLLVAILSVVSTWAKNVKQATSMATPIMLLIMFASMLPSLSIEFSAVTWKLIPVFNSILCLTNIFAFEYSVSGVVITCVSNLVYMLGLVFVLSKMFGSEKIMFNK